jgi:glycosyltransferase involved in cell wall biosynthesis
VVIHPATEEIFPNAVAEAMACGAAVLASDAGGTSELLGDDGSAGVLAPAGDAGATGALLAELLDDAERRHAMGATAQRRLATEFPMSAMIDGYEELAREVCRSGSGAM